MEGGVPEGLGFDTYCNLEGRISRDITLYLVLTASWIKYLSHHNVKVLRCHYDLSMTSTLLFIKICVATYDEVKSLTSTLNGLCKEPLTAT